MHDNFFLIELAVFVFACFRESKEKGCVSGWKGLLCHPPEGPVQPAWPVGGTGQAGRRELWLGA